MTELRPELTPLPERMKRLRVHRGYPIPFFVAWIDGEPEFRAMDQHKWIEAVSKCLCWICGEKLGRTQVFVLGPMCGITRTTVEPPCHRDCAVWSAINCPFLSRPAMVRREVSEDLRSCTHEAGEMIRRNPGVTLLWYTRGYTVFRDPNDKPLIRVGDPDRLEFIREGRKATREEIDESIRTGLPILSGLDKDDPAAMRELKHLTDRFLQLLPQELSQ